MSDNFVPLLNLNFYRKKHVFICLFFYYFFCLFSLQSCVNSDKQDIVFEKFKENLQSKGIPIDSVDIEGLVYITVNKEELKVSLDNVRKNYWRDKDDSHIKNFVNMLTTESEFVPPLEWDMIKDSVYYSFFPNDIQTEKDSFIYEEITKKFSRVYVFLHGNKIIWLPKTDLATLGIDSSTLANQILINTEKMAENTQIRVEQIAHCKVYCFENDYDNFKGTLLFAPTIRKYFHDKLGDKYYVVYPTRDFCYVFAKKDLDFLSTRLGNIVVKEYTASGYPITPEILEFAPDKITAIGQYAVE